MVFLHTKVSLMVSTKDKKRFNKEAKTYLTNREKWRAAQAYAERHGIKFAVWTEKSLKVLGVENY